MDRATAWAPRPAQLTTVRQASDMGCSPPTSRTMEPPSARPPVTGLRNATAAPWSSASPWRLSMYAWLSRMPVDGEISAATQVRAGSMPMASGATSTSFG